MPSIASVATSLLEAVGLSPAAVDAGSVSLWGSAVLAVAGVLAATPLVIQGARRFGWVAYPQDDRWHERPVALMGGTGIFLAVALGVGLTAGASAWGWPVWVGGALVFAAGLLDDLFDINPEAKFVAQIIATALLLYAGLAFWRGGPFWASVPLTFLWVIGVTNAVNLIDGMDGLAAGIAAIAASVLGVVALLVGDPGVAAVAFAVAGASAGFLAFNFKPARIFMGDCGSMALGYLLAVLALSVQGKGGPLAATVAPVVVLAVPIFDTTFVTVTRILRGQSVTEGGNDHTMHRLVLLGLSERKAVLFLYGVSLFFGALALAVYGSTAQLFYALLLLVAVATVVFGLYLGRSRLYQGNVPPVLTSYRDDESTTLMRVGAVMRALAGGVYWKSVVATVADALLVTGAFIAAHHLRFGGLPEEAHGALMIAALPAVVAFKACVFYGFDLYHGIWRHAGTPEVLRLAGASAVGSAGVGIGLWTYGAGLISPAVLVLDAILTAIAVGGSRFGFRALRQYFAAQRSVGRNALIYGTDAESILALRHLRRATNVERTAVGFLADNPDHVGLSVQGLDVLGTPDELERLRETHDVDEVIIPTGDVPRPQQQALREAAAGTGVDCRYFSVGLAATPPANGTPERLPAGGDGAEATRVQQQSG
jgi:UDP-GlcNAc:undecaprenyl-phosphate GlcNAc-1-phosphate transferase